MRARRGRRRRRMKVAMRRCECRWSQARRGKSKEIDAFELDEELECPSQASGDNATRPHGEEITPKAVRPMNGPQVVSPHDRSFDDFVDGEPRC